MNKPCADPANDPNDWFISRDGKQYSDDDFLTDDDRIEILERANEFGLEGEERIAFIESAQDDLEAEAKKDALRRRRWAKDKCFVECYFRLHCLDRALREQPSHGTWGGYDEDELKVLYEKINNRKP